MFEFVKKAFFAELTILSSFMSVNSLSCISMTNQECRVRQQIVYVNSNEPVFFPFSIKISVAVVVTISMIHMRKCVFLML